MLEHDALGLPRRPRGVHDDRDLGRVDGGLRRRGRDRRAEREDVVESGRADAAFARRRRRVAVLGRDVDFGVDDVAERRAAPLEAPDLGDLLPVRHDDRHARLVDCLSDGVDAERRVARRHDEALAQGAEGADHPLGAGVLEEEHGVRAVDRLDVRAARQRPHADRLVDERGAKAPRARVDLGEGQPGRLAELLQRELGALGLVVAEVLARAHRAARPVLGGDMVEERRRRAHVALVRRDGRRAQAVYGAAVAAHRGPDLDAVGAPRQVLQRRDPPKGREPERKVEDPQHPRQGVQEEGQRRRRRRLEPRDALRLRRHDPRLRRERLLDAFSL